MPRTAECLLQKICAAGSTYRFGGTRRHVRGQRHRSRPAARAERRGPEGAGTVARPPPRPVARDCRAVERTVAAGDRTYRGRRDHGVRAAMRSARPSGASSPCCSATSSARPSCRAGTILRICASCCAAITTLITASSSAMAAMSPITSATASSLISAGRGRRRTRRRRRSAPGSAPFAAVRELSLHARVGIASGTVVVGDIDGVGRRQAAAVAGETPNLAARLEALAGPDQVVIGGLTRQLVGAAFILDDLGPQELKGIAEPVRVWQVSGRAVGREPLRRPRRTAHAFYRAGARGGAVGRPL